MNKLSLIPKILWAFIFGSVKVISTLILLASSWISILLLISLGVALIPFRIISLIIKAGGQDCMDNNMLDLYEWIEYLMGTIKEWPNLIFKDLII